MYLLYDHSNIVEDSKELNNKKSMTNFLVVIKPNILFLFNKKLSDVVEIIFKNVLSLTLSFPNK